MDILEEIGVQRWRLRRNSAQSVALGEVHGEVQSEAQDDVLEQEVVEPSVGFATQETIQQSAEPNETGTNSPSDGTYVDANEGANSEPESKPEAEGIASKVEESQPQEPVITWSGLAAAISDASSCGSCSQSNPILGEGNIEADFMLVIDAPSARDVQEQTLVSGRQGQLLDAILAAIELDRDSIYLSSVFKCPPSEDSAVSASCGQMVHDQISLVQPKTILTMGEFATQSLLRANETLTQLQAKEHLYPNSGRLDKCAVVCTHSLAEMIDKPALKRQVWEDLKLYLNSRV